MPGRGFVVLALLLTSIFSPYAPTAKADHYCDDLNPYGPSNARVWSKTRAYVNGAFYYSYNTEARLRVAWMTADVAPAAWSVNFVLHAMWVHTDEGAANRWIEIG
jgi:hypothetical protein